MALTTVSYGAAGRSVLQIAETIDSVLRGYSGADPVGDVEVSTLGNTQWPAKHLSRFSFTDLELTLGCAQTSQLWQWATKGSVGPWKLEISNSDANYRERSRLEVEATYVKQWSLPKLSVQSKEQALAKFTLGVDRSKFLPSSSSTPVHLPTDTRPKTALCSNFRLSLPGLDDASKHVVSIEPIVVTQQLLGDDAQITENREVGFRASVTDLEVTFNALGQKDLELWMQHVLDGKTDERSVELALLGPDMKQVLLDLQFDGVVIRQLQRVVPDAPTSIKAWFYAESVRIQRMPT